MNRKHHDILRGLDYPQVQESTGGLEMYTPLDKGGLLSLLHIVIFNWLLVEICEEREEVMISPGNKRSLKSVWERGKGRRYIIKPPDTYPTKWRIA